MMRTLATFLILVVTVFGGCTAECPDSGTGAGRAAENVRLVQRTVDEGYNGRNPEVFDAAYHPDAVVWNNGRR